MDEIKLTFEETQSAAWRKVEAKIREREQVLLRKLRSAELDHASTMFVRGALKELEVLAGLAYEAGDTPP